MDIQFIAVPYDSGRRGFRMGAGPEHLLRSGIVAALERDGHRIRSIILEATAEDGEQATFELARRTSMAVRAASERGAFPILLAGNCMMSVGAFAGLSSAPAMLWFDAHADFNTPATSASGFLDGMSLAVMTGRCWTDQTYRIGGFTPLPDSELIMVGVRDVDIGEKPALQDVRLVQSAAELQKELAALTRNELYLHIDLDALDPSALTANNFATAGGLSVETLRACIGVAHTKRISAVAFTAYDPTADAANAAPDIVLQAIRGAISP